jgi:hypothetical protein
VRSSLRTVVSDHSLRRCADGCEVVRTVIEDIPSAPTRDRDEYDLDRCICLELVNGFFSFFSRVLPIDAGMCYRVLPQQRLDKIERESPVREDDAAEFS